MNPEKIKPSAIISYAASAFARLVRACLKHSLELFCVTRKIIGFLSSRLLAHSLENEPVYFVALN